MNDDDKQLQEAVPAARLPDGQGRQGIDYEINDEGLLVWSKGYLLKRGYCCGSGCRNCPYHDSVVSDSKP